jgi:hypothetical protein
MSRDIGTVPAALLKDENLWYWEYLKIGWGGELGTTRHTTFPGDATNLTGHSIDVGDGEGEQFWDSFDLIFEPGYFEQGESPLSISDLRFGNADNSFNETYVQGRDGGVMGAHATVYLGFWDAVPPRTFRGAFPIYDGLLDRAEVQSDWVRVQLLAGSSPLDQLVPRRRFTAAWGFRYLPKPNLKIVFPNGQTFTAPNPTDTQTGADDGGAGTPPPPGGIGNTGNRTVIRTTSDRPATRTVQRPGRDTTVVTR